MARRRPTRASYKIDLLISVISLLWTNRGFSPRFQYPVLFFVRILPWLGVFQRWTACV